MTAFAFGVKCGFFGASGLGNGVAPSAATACEAKNMSSSNPDRATAAYPPPACQKNSRRVRPQKSRGGCIGVSPGRVHWHPGYWLVVTRFSGSSAPDRLKPVTTNQDA